MNTLRIAFIPGLIAGFNFRFYQLFWMGVIFHRYQRETPKTCRPEGSRSYIAASLLHILAAMGIACLFTLVVRFEVGIFAVGFHESFYFAICIWGALALPILLESAIFVPLHRLVIGQLLDWVTSSVLACIMIWWCLKRKPPQAVETYQKLACHRMVIRIRARNMKCAAVFIFVLLALTSQSFGVLRPRFPVKAEPPFSGDMIVRGDDMVPKSFTTAPVPVPR